jgi:hypothetical protein
MKSIVLTIAMAVLLAGCASGTRFTQRQVDQIEIGATTEAELIQIFGDPTSSTVSAEGSKTLAWMWSYSSIGGFRSGAKVLTVMLSPDGLAKDYGVSNYASPGLF